MIYRVEISAIDDEFFTESSAHHYVYYAASSIDLNNKFKEAIRRLKEDMKEADE